MWKRFEDFKTVAMTSESSQVYCGKALCDLGPSIKLMPMSIFKQLWPLRLYHLGIPFLATERTVIDVYKDELTMRVNDEQVTFKIPKAMRFSNEGLEECKILLKESDQPSSSDNLKGHLQSTEEPHKLLVKQLPPYLKYSRMGSITLYQLNA
ncbi:hypothetical protein MTR_2g073660 [Medicago truncatula]|uniref:Uncharacterized protein n=1 Tax=Medicago truncatula TaxID=3880 RepID=A0A072V945_MEDTR|nr:hypothetical protein MTR_2g073660 [Medicago truncatula]